MRKAPRFHNVLRFGYLSSILLGAILTLLSAVTYPLTAQARGNLSTYPLTPHSSLLGPPAQAPGFVYVAPFKLPITPISAQYFDRLVKTAEEAGAMALIVEVDTPGGLVDSMQVMVQRMLASRVPVIMYVSPQGAMAASAGLFIVYASHLAVMAPNTTIGSAEVIFESTGEGEGSNGNDEALRRKATNELVSRIRSLAETRGRNADFGEKAVRESHNVNTQQAVDQDVVDFMAVSVEDLLNKADGRVVAVGSEQVTLRTKGVERRALGTNFAEDVLLVITNPSVAFVLISLGTLGITWEFINPGSVFPGVVGAICLLTGFLALGTLPINVAGFAFMILAIVLFIADIFTPTHGILTAGGIAALIIGGLLLVNTEGVPGVPTVSPYVVSGTAVGLGIFFFYAVYKALRARKLQPTTGFEGLLGRVVPARTDLLPTGNVFVEGELWQATTVDGEPVRAGESVRIVAAEGLRLKVKPERDQGSDQLGAL